MPSVGNRVTRLSDRECGHRGSPSANHARIARSGPRRGAHDSATTRHRLCQSRAASERRGVRAPRGRRVSFRLSCEVGWDCVRVLQLELMDARPADRVGSWRAGGAPRSRRKSELRGARGGSGGGGQRATRARHAARGTYRLGAARLGRACRDISWRDPRGRDPRAREPAPASARPRGHRVTGAGLHVSDRRTRNRRRARRARSRARRDRRRGI